MLRPVGEVLSIERNQLGPTASSVLLPERKTTASYTERSRRYRRPRHETSLKTRQAGALAQLVRERFYLPRGVRSAPLRSFMIQAFRLFKRGYTYDELCLAIEEAVTAPWCRKRPSRGFKLIFFLGWVKRIRSRGLRDDTRRRQHKLDAEGLSHVLMLPFVPTPPQEVPCVSGTG